MAAECTDFESTQVMPSKEGVASVFFFSVKNVWPMCLSGSVKKAWPMGL